MSKSALCTALAISAACLSVPCQALAVNYAPFWVHKMPAASPAARDGNAMAYDAAHGQVVLFGGCPTTACPSSDTWVWDGTNWTQKSPASGPSARRFHAMAYDAAHGQVVLFGGATNGPGLSDTWVWDGTNWTQKMVAGPSGREAHAMVYDAAHGQVVLFGGVNSGTELPDTWVWDGTNWTQKSPASSPSARSNHAMAYDSVHGQVVLFGGYDGSNRLSDTWVWDGTNWTQKSPASSPSARSNYAMAYDAAHGQVLLFGGENGGVALSDTLAWDGTNWMPEMPMIGPPARSNQAMAYDAAHDQVVLFGGDDGAATNFSDTWIWTHGIFASAGNPQSTPAGLAFSFPLEVTVTDSTGAYVNGAIVTFAGPSGMISFTGGATATTGSDGRAHVNATAGATAGSYMVTASLTGGDFTEFLLSNVNTADATRPCQVTTAIDGNQGGSLRSQVATCGKGGTITFSDSAPNAVITQLQDIQLTQDLTIDGGAGAIIDANQLSRIFLQFGGSVTLKNLTLQNGSAKGGSGGTANFGAGGAAGMGGAVFVNGGTLIIGNTTFASNMALGGHGGASLGRGGGCGAGGGSGHDGADGQGSSPNGSGNGGSGGDFGSSGGSGADGSGGSCTLDGNGGFGGGGSGNVAHNNGGFGGAGGTGGSGGSFGGNGGGGVGTGGGGGSGLGGAIFIRNGLLLLNQATFISNASNKGLNGGGAGDGQGKGGALFIMNTATALAFSDPTFTGNSATDAGMNTSCSSVVGGVDSNNICGIVTGATISPTSGGGQSTPANTMFTNALMATVVPNISGIPVVFSGPTTGASTNPANTPAMTNVMGVASASVTANGTVGGPYTVVATIGGVGTSATYSLTNTVSDLTISKSHIGSFSQGQKGATYTITVSNVGTGPTSGTVMVTDTLPSGLMATAISGTGWNCVLGALSCTRSDVLNSGSYAPITVTVTVAGNAPSSVTNMAAVSGGGEINTSNDTASDPTTINPIVNVSGQVRITQNGFARNRGTGIWTATMTVTNVSGSSINAPIQVVLNSLTPGVTMTNNMGIRNGSPYITVLGSGSLAPGAAVSVLIQFTNPNNVFITFTPETDSGMF